MRTCTICRCGTELDDIVIGGAGGRCICLRCFDRQTGSSRRMSHELRRVLTATLADIA